MDYGDLYRSEYASHQTTKELLAKREADRDELVKWRRWADYVLGGPGMMPTDKAARDEIERRLKAACP